MQNVDWDFSVRRHLQTMMRIGFEEGEAAVDERADALRLPEAFKQRLLAAIKGEDTDGKPY